MFLGIEIGGTKLQLGVGPGDGKLRGLWRGVVDPAEGSDGIQRQILSALPALYRDAGVQQGQLRGVGVGFGGPIDDRTRTVITSHQIAGWDGFPLADWIDETLHLPVALGNDADVAGLAEALHGAGKGCSPLFYVTVGTGIGGGLIVNGEIYRGVGRGAAEIGHLQVRLEGDDDWSPLEDLASGRAIESRYQLWTKSAKIVPVPEIVRRAIPNHEDDHAFGALEDAILALAQALCHVIALLCPRRIVIGGGVSLIGEELFFARLRRAVSVGVFGPFAGLTGIVPAALGEEVVVHGAIALIRKQHESKED